MVCYGKAVMCSSLFSIFPKLALCGYVRICSVLIVSELFVICIVCDDAEALMAQQDADSLVRVDSAIIEALRGTFHTDCDQFKGGMLIVGFVTVFASQL